MRFLASFVRSTGWSILNLCDISRGKSPWRWVGLLIFGLTIGGLSVGARPSLAQNATFNIPPVKIPLKIKEQTVAITASGVVSVHSSKDQNASIFRLELRADLGELQQNVTALLASQLDKDDACGDRIAIEHAELV